MQSQSRQNRFEFQSFTPITSLRTGTTSLRRLRTAFSPTRSFRSVSPSSSTGSTGTTSPLTRTASPDSHRSRSSTHSGHSGHGSIRQLLLLRRKPSVLDLEMEEERQLFSHELEMLEPRPRVGSYGSGEGAPGIFEVLDGKF